MLNNKYQLFILPIAMLCIGLYLVPLNIYGPDFSKVPGDLGDARFNNYILEHDHQYFTGIVDKYWDAPFMYPYKNVIAFSDNLLGTAPIYSAFRLIGYDRETAFQLWLLGLFILNFVCCYWALNKWSKNSVLSSVGAYIFSFSILLVGNIYNVQTIPRFIVPLVFYWCWKYFNQKDLKYFIYIGLGIVFQFYCAIYLGFLLLYALLFLFIAYLIVYKDFSLFSQFKKLETTGYHLLVISIICVLFYPFIQPYISISNEAGIPSYEEVKQYIPTIRSYFFTSKDPVFWGLLSEHAVPLIKNWWCHFLFIGALPWLGITVVPFVLRSKKTESSVKKFIAFLSLSLFLSFIFCLNINGFSLYQLIYQIPGFSAMRSMNRIINVEIVFFILIFVFVFKELSKYNEELKWLVLCLPVLVILDNAIYSEKITKYDKKESHQRIELVSKEIRFQHNAQNKAIAFMPDTIENLVHQHLDIMLACQELNIACVNAYTGHNPGQYNDFFARMNEESLLKWCEFNKINSESIQRIHPGIKYYNGKSDLRESHINLIAIKGKYVASNTNTSDTLIANKEMPTESGQITMVYLEPNIVVLKSSINKYVTLDPGKNNYLIANSDSMQQAARFAIINLDGGYLAFKTVKGEYVCADQDLNGRLVGNRPYIGDWEKFRLVEVGK